MSILGSLWQFVFGKHGDITHNVNEGMAEESVLEQEERQEEGESDAVYAGAKQGEKAARRLQDDDAVIRSVLSHGALKQPEARMLRQVIRDMQSTAANLERAITNIRQLVADNEKTNQTSVAVVKNAIQNARTIVNQAKEFVDSEIRNSITRSADQILAIYAEMLQLYEAEQAEDMAIDQALRTYQKSDRNLHDAVEALSAFIQTGKTAPSRDFVAQCEAIVAQVRQSIALMERYGLGMMRTDERIKRLQRAERKQWPALLAAVAEAQNKNAA